ncbi:hypothetical protein GCM10022399_20010 [Terrabacter ginsenosidimutans]|uniref:Uncharacterized protein n=1 Tax=Terrabacter ginsenosidimutans TaxID=490575 RepID=A0ABP7DFD3_9MICO
MSDFGICARCDETVALADNANRVVVAHVANGKLCSGGGKAPRPLKYTGTRTAPSSHVGAQAASGTGSAANSQLTLQEKILTTLVVGGLLVWLIVSIVSGRIHQAQADERVRQGVAEVCNNYKQAVATHSGELTFLASNVNYSEDIDSTEFAAKVKEACPADVSALDAQWHPASENAGVQMSDCERRIYAVTHVGRFTDEEENELIRGIRATC